MSDQQNLHDAFAEYERRADALGAARDTTAVAPRPDRVRRGPVLLVAASVALVLAVAGGVVWLATGSTTSGPGQQAAGPGGTTTSNGAPTLSGGPVPSGNASSTGHAPVVISPSHGSVLPTLSRTGRPPVTRTGTAPELPPSSSSSSTGSSGGAHVPANAAQMERALRAVLGDTATFTVRQHEGNYLMGILTATKTGARGGFDIQASSGNPGDKPFCEDPGRGSHCSLSKPAQGGRLAVEHEKFGRGRSTLYYVDYVFPNGATYLFHLSNRADPKGAGKTFGTTPPLTLKQMTAIIESSRWGQN